VRLQFLKDDQNDSEYNVQNKDFHTVPSIKKDLDMIKQQLTEEKVFEVIDTEHTKITNHYYSQLIGTVFANDA